jgi:hypothetical protein
VVHQQLARFFRSRDELPYSNAPDFDPFDNEWDLICQPILLMLAIVWLLGRSRWLGIHLALVLGKICNPIGWYSSKPIESVFQDPITLEGGISDFDH